MVASLRLSASRMNADEGDKENIAGSGELSRGNS